MVTQEFDVRHGGNVTGKKRKREENGGGRWEEGKRDAVTVTREKGEADLWGIPTLCPRSQH
jgi:hypothetical protein